ncbi:MAG: tRNA (adenosine(37)-N6)-dimethylallyltransferase MiaA [Bacteroidia bacterium]|nr:tRNA (adenosine(37)-N6)-dimethylallyltransferase MiaA [Bacteroidia bacterium]
MTSLYNIVTILGPTASGKTRFAAELCCKINGEIISADSRQVYKGMDIGTGKDIKDYEVASIKVPYHIIDIVETGYQYNVFEFQRDFLKAFNKIKLNSNFPVLCGGTGLYIDAALKGYKLIDVPINTALREKLENKTLDELNQILKKYKKLHNVSDSDTVKRAVRAIEIEEYYLSNTNINKEYPELKSLVIGIDCERELRRTRITERLNKRLNDGLIEEVQQLLNRGITADQLIYYGLEYKYITEYLTGKYNFKEFFSKLEIAIHQFAKRQMTYFRSMEKKGTKINWINCEIPNEEKIEMVLNKLKITNQ